MGGWGGVLSFDREREGRATDLLLWNEMVCLWNNWPAFWLSCRTMNDVGRFAVLYDMRWSLRSKWPRLMPEVDDQEANRRHVNGGKVAGYKCLKMNVRIRSGFIHPQSWLSLASDSIRTILGCNDFVFMVRLRWRWCWLAESKFLLVVLNRNLLGECCCYFLVGRNFCRLVCTVKYCTLNCNCYRHRIEYEDRKSDQTRGQFVAGADL